MSGPAPERRLLDDAVLRSVSITDESDIPRADSIGAWWCEDATEGARCGGFDAPGKLLRADCTALCSPINEFIDGREPPRTSKKDCTVERSGDM